MTTISDIQSMIESLTPEQIKAVLATTTNNVRKVDSRYKARRIAKTNLYFKMEPYGSEQILMFKILRLNTI